MSPSILLYCNDIYCLIQFCSLQILESQNLKEFPSQPLDSVQPQDSSLITTMQDQPESFGLSSLGQHVELEFRLGSEAGVMAAGSPADVETSIGEELDFASGEHRRPAAGIEASPANAETQRRLSLQEPQTPLDSRTPQRHGSDRGGS